MKNKSEMAIAQSRRAWYALANLAFCLATAICLATDLRAQDAGNAPLTSTLTVDLSQPGQPISKYIYGQFIEHLGRCIHDGIWAEKLHDRKFLLEPAKSPWQLVHPTGAEFEIFPDTAGAYAGDHCLALFCRNANGGKCGIEQRDIGLVAGKEYTGYVILASVGFKTPPVEVRLNWGDGPGAGQSIPLGNVGREYRKYPFHFRAGATTDDAALSVLLGDAGYVWVAGVSLMPADNVHGLRADTLALIRKLNPPIVRWPGGNFVSGYNWKDGLSDRDRRPPRWDHAWGDVEDNDFGIDEFMAFCAEIKSDAYVAVNTGLGSVQSAADEVEYCNGSTSTRWGRERARNGHPKPYPVAWWGIGNEMYGPWQMGNVPVERYAIRHDAFVTAMRAEDPQARFVAVGQPGLWNDEMLPVCAANMDLLSGHHYSERKFKIPFNAQDSEKYEQGFADYSGSVAAGVHNLVNDLRKRHGQGDTNIDHVRLAVDEWGIVRDWDGTPDGPGLGTLGHYYALGDAIAAARAVHELLRSSDIVTMANWAQMVNAIGAIDANRNEAVMGPVGEMLTLYRAHLNGNFEPVQVDGKAPLDAVAARNLKRGSVAFGLINYSVNQPVLLELRAADGGKFGAVSGWRIDGPNLEAINVPGKPEAVSAVRLNEPISLTQPLVLPPHSITVLETK